MKTYTLKTLTANFADRLDLDQIVRDLNDSDDRVILADETVYTDEGEIAGRYTEFLETQTIQGAIYYVHDFEMLDADDCEIYDNADDVGEAEDAILRAYAEACYEADEWERDKQAMWRDFQ